MYVYIIWYCITQVNVCIQYIICIRKYCDIRYATSASWARSSGWKSHIHWLDSAPLNKWRKLLQWGYPNSWMVYFMDNPIKMDDLGVLHFRKPPHYYVLKLFWVCRQWQSECPRLHVAHPWTYLPEKLWQWPVQAAFLWFVYPTLAAKSKYPPCTAASVACFQQRRPHHGGKSCVISGLAFQWFRVTGIPSRIMEQQVHSVFNHRQQALSCPWAELKKNYVPRTSQKKWCSPKHKRPLMILQLSWVLLRMLRCLCVPTNFLPHSKF